MFFLDARNSLYYILYMTNISLQREFTLKSITLGPFPNNAEVAYSKYAELYNIPSADLLVYEYVYGGNRWISVPKILLDYQHYGCNPLRISLLLSPKECRIVNGMFFIHTQLVYDTVKFEKFLCRDQRLYPTVKRYFAEVGDDYHTASVEEQAKAWQRAEEEAVNAHRHKHATRRQELTWTPLFRAYREFALHAFTGAVAFSLPSVPKKKSSIWSLADDASLHQWYKPGYKKRLSEDEWNELIKKVSNGKFNKQQILTRIETLNKQTRKESKTIKDGYLRRKFLKDNLLRRCGRAIPKPVVYDPSLPSSEPRRRGPAKLDATKAILAASREARKSANV
jgi:hypothetical protein